MNLTNIAKDLGTGIVLIAGIVAIISGLVFLGEAVNMTKDNIRLALAVPFFLYFTYLFGGLSRSMFFKN